MIPKTVYSIGSIKQKGSKVVNCYLYVFFVVNVPVQKLSSVYGIKLKNSLQN